METQNKQGYKQTEVGLIPEEWEVKEFGEICSPTKMKFNPLHSDNRPCVELEDLSQETGRLLSLSDSINKASLKTIFSAGDVLFGKLRPYLRKYFFADFDGVCSTEIWALSAKPKIYSRFVFYQVQTNRIIDSANISTGTKMPRAEWKTVAETKIPLPPLPEQTAIASALSDMDALIAQTEKLNEKKKAIKQGVMQELLTGKKRLKGFENRKGYKQTEVGLIPEDWEVSALGEITDRIIGGGTPSRSNASYWGNEIPWVTVKDFATFDPHSAQEYITSTGLKNSSSNLIPKGVLITSTRMALGKAVIYERDVAINQDLKALLFKKNVNSKFFYFWFQANEKTIEDLGSGSTVMGVSLIDLKKILFPLPPLPEQTAIASASSDIDEDIRIREAKLNKLKLQKQGMMQALLTGKIRVI